MKPMNNSDIIKLACFKEMAPNDPDWFYIRAASMARHLYMRAPCGVGAFTKIYGGIYAFYIIVVYVLGCIWLLVLL